MSNKNGNGKIINIGDNKKANNLTVHNISEHVTAQILDVFAAQLYKQNFSALSAGPRAEVKQYAGEFFTHCRDQVLNR